jgi:hypothetical protein
MEWSMDESYPATYSTPQWRKRTHFSQLSVKPHHYSQLLVQLISVWRGLSY